MYSYEIQKYLEGKDYKLTLDEYYNLVDSSPQIVGIKFEGLFDFYHKKTLSTLDGYSWGIHVLNKGYDSSMLGKINF